MQEIVIWHQLRDAAYLRLSERSLQLSAYNNNSRALRCRVILILFLQHNRFSFQV